MQASMIVFRSAMVKQPASLIQPSRSTGTGFAILRCLARRALIRRQFNG